MKNSNIILTLRSDKYEYLTGEEILPSALSQIIQQAKFTYSPLGKAFEKQTEKQVDTLKSLNLLNKTNELKQIENIFSKNQMDDLIIDKLKKIVQSQNNIKLGDLEYTTKRGKRYNFSRYSLPITFLRDIHEESFSSKNADEEQILIKVEC